MSSVMVTPTLAWISKSAQPLPLPARRKPSSIQGAMVGSEPGANRSGRIPWPSSAHSRVVPSPPAPSQIGRSGSVCRMDLSGLPSPLEPGPV
jgi:hypothetical protein